MSSQMKHVNYVLGNLDGDGLGMAVTGFGYG